MTTISYKCWFEIGFYFGAIYENGRMVRLRNFRAKYEAIDYIKECWRYIRRTPRKREINTIS